MYKYIAKIPDSVMAWLNLQSIQLINQRKDDQNSNLGQPISEMTVHNNNNSIH